MSIRVIELFAGVGGFRVALEEPSFSVVWSNQWEPARKVQHASACYLRRFPSGGHSNEDIATVSPDEIPDHELLVGGFPCQDYSVATTRAQGIQGKKGVLWWEIDRIVRAKRPPYILLENVDRLLRSPTTQRGRDFGVVLRCLTQAGYRVEWRALNAADYGFPQKRRRTFIFAAREDTPWGTMMDEVGSSPEYLLRAGFFAREFPVRSPAVRERDPRNPDVSLPRDIKKLSDEFEFHFLNSGVAVGDKVWTRKAEPKTEPLVTLGSILQPDAPESYYVPPDQVERWRYLKGSKSEYRKSADGFEYAYKEGAIPFPDSLDQPARTILTTEGGTSPSRFKHLIEDPWTKRLRVLTPLEVERLNGFPDGWTEDMPEGKRYFCMGNALVVGLVRRMGTRLAKTADNPKSGFDRSTRAALRAAEITQY